MKKILPIAFYLGIATTLNAQQQPTANDPSNNSNGIGSKAYWSRAGNTNVNGNNNIFGTRWNSPIYFATGSANGTFNPNNYRMKLNGNVTNPNINGYNIWGFAADQVNTTGYLGLGANKAQSTGPSPRIWSSLNGRGPYSLLHLNGRAGSQVIDQGYRPWMKTGVTFTDNSDAMYVGTRIVFNDITEAIFNWSDNPTGPGVGPDDMVFRFTQDAIPSGTTAISPNRNSANDLDGRHIARFTGTGNFGIGATFGLVQQGYVRPQNILHLSRTNFDNTWMRITNEGVGETSNDGLQIGVEGTSTTSTVARFQWKERTPIIFQTEWDNNAGFGNTAGERLRIASVSANTSTNPYGHFDNITRVSISHLGNSPILRPRSLLHLGYDLGGSGFSGHRSWMDIGTLTQAGTDHVWLGLKQEGSSLFANRMDAVLAWGSENSGPISSTGPDNLRFVFTSQASQPGPGNTQNGLEVARMIPNQHPIYPTDYGMIGIGNSFSPGNANAAPSADYVGATLDIDGDLRIRKVEEAQPTQTNTKVLVIDQNDHNRVFWSDALGFGEECTTPFNQSTPWTNGRYVNMDNNNFYFADAAGNTGSVYVGPDNACGPIPSRLQVQNDSKIVGELVTSDAALTTPIFGIVARANNQSTGFAVGVSGIGLATTGIGPVMGVLGTSQTSSSSRDNIGVRGVAANGLTRSIAGDFVTASSFSAANYGVRSLTSSSVANSTNYGGSFVSTNNGAATNYGVHAQAVGGAVNYGVWAEANGNVNGPGTNNWAGFFNGDLFGSGVYQGSDRKLKKDIKPIEKSIDIVNKLNPVNYTFDVENHKYLVLPTEKQWGFIAQEVEEVLPELTKKAVVAAKFDTTGKQIEPAHEILSLNYEGIIPILTKAIQEQQAEIDALKEMLGMKETGDTPSNVPSVKVDLSTAAILYQNTPNPFGSSTEIRFYVPDNVEAVMIFHDSYGKVIREANVSGSSKVDVNATDLAAGIYTYSLVVNGKVVDTKKMVKQ